MIVSSQSSVKLGRSLTNEQINGVKQFEEKKFGVTFVEGINLYTSELTSKGPVYSKIDSWEFEG